MELTVSRQHLVCVQSDAGTVEISMDHHGCIDARVTLDSTSFALKDWGRFKERLEALIRTAGEEVARMHEKETP